MADDIRLVIGVDDRDLIRTQKEQKKFERNLLTIESALRSGQINANRYTSELNKQAKQLSRLGGTYRKANSEVRTYAASIRKLTDDQLRMAQATNMAGKSTNRFGMYAQQVGYQVGDFFVQVQSGTSALVAFGQQGTQLAGLLPGLAGAIIGIGLAVGTMLLRTLLQAKEAADDAKDSLLSLADAQDALSKSASTYQNKINMLEFGVDSEAEAAALQRLVQLRKDLLAEQSKQGEGALTISERAKELQNETVATIEKSIAKTEELVNANAKARDIYEEVSGFQKLIREQAETNSGAEIKSIKTIVKAFKEAAIARKQVKDALDKNTQSMERQVALSELEVDAINLVNGAEKALADKKAEYARQDHIAQLLSQGIRGDNLKVAISEYDALVKQLKVQNEAKIAAKEKLRVEKEAVKESKTRAQIIYNALLADKRANDASKKAFALQKQSLQVSVDNAKMATVYKDELYRQNLIERQKIFTQQLSGKITADQAKELLILTDELYDQKQALIDINEKEKARLDLIQLQVDLETKRGQSLDKLTGGNKEFFDPRNESGVSGVIFRDRGKPSDKSDTEGKSTGQTPSEKLKEQITAIQNAANKEKELVGYFGAEREVRSQIIDLQDKYGKVFTTTHEKQVRAAIELRQLEQKRQEGLQKAIDQQKALADTIASSMETAMMSMVDGTTSVKDAFKSMAADIIKELYRVLVVQEMVAAAKTAMDARGGFLKMAAGFFGMADGGAFSGGSQMKAYANGGVVGGPTTFGMAGGKTGLMGEAGPEAIMPLKRGANGKLGVQMEGGGGDTINVVQNFSFAANGDDSVKRIIAQAAPQIAQMTKNSMLNDRRRGGTTKAVFG